MAGFLLIDGTAHPVALVRLPDGRYAPAGDDTAAVAPGAVVAADGDRIWVHLGGRNWELRWEDAVSHFAGETAGDEADGARAPMPGAVVAVAVAMGAHVATGDALLVIESMKLETTIRAPRDGVIEAVHVAVGQTFERDALLVGLVPVAA